MTEALTSVIAARQDEDGAFYTLPPIRPPLESSDVTATAQTLRALQLYGRSQDERIARARDWLRAAKPTVSRPAWRNARRRTSGASLAPQPLAEFASGRWTPAGAHS